jgi:hypothetical protein
MRRSTVMAVLLPASLLVRYAVSLHGYSGEGAFPVPMHPCTHKICTRVALSGSLVAVDAVLSL